MNKCLSEEMFIASEAGLTICSKGVRVKPQLLTKNSDFSVLKLLSHLQSVDCNFLARMKYGNRAKDGITMAQWNAGGGHLKNKMDEIQQIVKEFHPKVLGISESCLLKDHNKS